jgi:hypothetical protein
MPDMAAELSKPAYIIRASASGIRVASRETNLMALEERRGTRAIISDPSAGRKIIKVK